MPKEWTGNLVGLMHTHRITNKMLADHMDITEQYASMILNGKREPPGAEKRFAQAVAELIQDDSNDNMGGE